jgi:hypothetical protein
MPRPRIFVDFRRSLQANAGTVDGPIGDCSPHRTFPFSGGMAPVFPNLRLWAEVDGWGHCLATGRPGGPQSRSGLSREEKNVFFQESNPYPPLAQLML